MAPNALHFGTFFSVILPLFGLLSSCGEPESAGISIQVEQAWARATPLLPGAAGTPGAPESMAPRANAAAYLVLENRTQEPEWLLGGATPVAGAVEIHESRLEGGVMRMRPLDSLVIPGGGRVELRPGGTHLMLTGITRSLTPGDTLEVVLRFRKAGAVRVRVPVEGLGRS